MIVYVYKLLTNPMKYKCFHIIFLRTTGLSTKNKIERKYKKNFKFNIRSKIAHDFGHFYIVLLNVFEWSQLCSQNKEQTASTKCGLGGVVAGHKYEL